MKGIKARAENETKDSRGNKCLTDGMINWMKLFFQGVQISSRFTILFYIKAESKIIKLLFPLMLTDYHYSFQMFHKRFFSYSCELNIINIQRRNKKCSFRYTGFRRILYLPTYWYNINCKKYNTYKRCRIRTPIYQYFQVLPLGHPSRGLLIIYLLYYCYRFIEKSETRGFLLLLFCAKTLSDEKARERNFLVIALGSLPN